MAKSVERLFARELRRGGASIREIAAILQVSKDTASRWCADIQLSPEQVALLIQRDRVGGAVGRAKAAEHKKAERLARFQSLAHVGHCSVNSLSDRELYLVGIALYWAEGSKGRGRVRLCNSDPKLVLLYIAWLTRSFHIRRNDLTCRLSINAAHQYRQVEIENFWVKQLRIPLCQFTKTTLIRAKQRKVYENMNEYFGVIDVTVRKSANLNYQIVGAISGLRGVFDGKISFEAG